MPRRRRPSGGPIPRSPKGIAGNRTKKDLYKSIRKPVAPPTKVEGDRRRNIRKAEARREAEEAAPEGDADVSGP